MRKFVNIAFFGLFIVAIILLMALVDCSGERPSLEQSGLWPTFHGISL